MKKGLEFKEFLVELARQNKSKADYLVKTDNMAIDTSDGVRLAISASDGIETIDPLEIGVNAHRQLASYLNIPNRYYDKMLESDPDLLGINVNRWLKRADGQRMIRTLDGKARAVLSNRYCRIDNYDIANAVLFLASDEPSFITGQLLEVAGGFGLPSPLYGETVKQ